MTIRLTQLFGLIVGTLMAVAALPAAAETPSEQADALLSGLIQTNEHGLAVIVAKDGKILFEKGYGLADLEDHVPVTLQTIFRIASVTKPFTAAAIMKLQEEGKLSVNDKLSKYIPDFPHGNEVTLRELLTHTSGIHSYTYDPFYWSHRTNLTTTGAIIEKIKKYPYDFNPGTKWSYDNSGYTLLGYIVEKVSVQSYADFLHQKFFEPLDMTNTGVYRAHPVLQHGALGYSLSTNGFERVLDDLWITGDGALYSTVEDLYRWNEGVFNGRVLDAASLKAAFTPVKTKEKQGDNPDTGYGFGWIISHYRGLREISHGGYIQGFRSSRRRRPDETFTVAILANAAPGRPNADAELLAQQLVDIFLADKLAPLPAVNPSVSPKSYDALTGRYDFLPGPFIGPDGGEILTISRRGPHLFLREAGHSEDEGDEIFPQSDTEFFTKVKGVDAQITFVKDSSGNAVKLIIHKNGIEWDATRVKDATGKVSKIITYQHGQTNNPPKIQ